MWNGGPPWRRRRSQRETRGRVLDAAACRDQQAQPPPWPLADCPLALTSRPIPPSLLLFPHSNPEERRAVATAPFPVELSTEGGGSRSLAVLPSGQVLMDESQRAQSRAGERRRARARAAAAARRRAAARGTAAAAVTSAAGTVASRGRAGYDPRSPKPQPAADVELRIHRSRNHYLRF